MIATSTQTLDPIEPPVLARLMDWCFDRTGATAPRRVRVPLLFAEFREVIDRVRPIVTIAGTSGKGTTCALLEAVLLKDGQRTGVYSKPHLITFNERFRIDGQPVTTPELVAHAESIFARLTAFTAHHGIEHKPVFYEALLLIAFSLFADAQVTFAVFEAGIGGANCATSYLPSVLSILTSVDLDHQQDLGATIEQIAKDKAGIAPPGGTLVVGAAVSDAAREVVLRECSERNVRCVETSCSPLLAPSRESLQTQLLELKGDEGKFQVLLPFPGQHQALNLLTVAAAVRQLHALGLLSAFESITGVAHARMAGRFEFIPGRPAWLLDVAHNPASIRALIATVDALGVTPRVRVVVGASERHDHAAMISMLTAWGVPLTFCDGFPRAVSATQLAKESGRAAHVFTSPDDAIDHGFSQTEDSDGIILITGSLFLVGACRRRLIQRGVLSNP